MCDKEKKYIDKLRGKWDITSQKTNCFFDTIAILKEES